MSRLRSRVVLAASVSLALAASAGAQTSGTDNRDGYFVNFEEPPIRPMALAPNGNRIWVVNAPDASVTILQKNTMAILGALPVGLGPVSIVRRPTTPEMWVVCHVSNTIAIFDAATLRLLDSVETGHEPCGLVFDTNGTTAYVTNSQDSTIDVISAASRTVTATIEFGSNDVVAPGDPGDPVFNAEEPRALVLDGTRLYALSFESGNGTVPVAAAAQDRWAPFIAGTLALPPPDRDVLSFDVVSPGAAGTVSLWRMGSLNFDLDARPGSVGPVLYVSNVDYNNTLVGEHQFPVHGIARHRVSYAAPIATGAPPPQATTHIDLNVDQHPGLGGASRFATPNEMAFDAAGGTLYVACYETGNAAVIDAATDEVIAELQCGSGPRGVLLDEAGERLYVYNRADLTISVFTLPIPPGTVVAPLMTVSGGYDPTPLPVKNGRRHAIDASNSSNGLQSCNTCHMDGAKDGIGWDLGSFTGGLHDVAKDAKGLKVTQSLRGIEETPPFHWRGDRNDLLAFNPAFEGLLGGTPLGEADFADFQAYVFSLSYGPNPVQPIERTYSVGAQRGVGFFVNEPSAVRVADTALNGITLSCNDCHSMNGFSGTLNQVVNDSETGTFADDASQLRGMFDKESDGGNYAALGQPFPLNKIPATGWGFNNQGTVDNIVEFILPQFAMPLDQEIDIARFCLEFDSGTAPAVGSAWTLTDAKAGSPAASPVTQLLVPQAHAGNVDLVARGWIDVGSGPTFVRLLYRTAISEFESISSAPGFGPFTYDELDDLADSGDAVLLFAGSPVKSGYRYGLDRDMDGLKDRDETALGTSSSAPDSDGDGFPDGHEFAHSSNPMDPSSVPVDVTAPLVQNAIVSWRNSNVAKIRWTTSEPATSEVEVASVAGGPIAYSETFTESQFKTDHVMVVRGMNPGQAYEYSIGGADPALNPAVVVTLGDAMQDHLFDSVHSGKVNMGVVSINPSTGQMILRATTTVVDQNGIPEAGSTVSGRFVEWLPGQPAAVTNFGPTFPTGASGKAIATYSPIHPQGSGAIVEVVVDVIADDSKLHFHPLEAEFSDRLTL